MGSLPMAEIKDPDIFELFVDSETCDLTGNSLPINATRQFHCIW